MKYFPARMVAIGATVAALTVGLTSALAATPTALPAPPATSKADASVHPTTQGAAVYPASRPELNYVAITACRIVDTRYGGGRILAGHARSFAVRGSAGFSAQGGAACGIPANAQSITASLTVPAVPSGSGYFVAYPAGGAVPTATAVTYPRSTTVTTSQTLRLAAAGTEPSLRVRNAGHPANLIVDVTGYYVEQMEGLVGPSATVYSGSSSILSATNPGPGVYQVTLDRDVTYCTPSVSPYGVSGGYASAYTLNGATVTVSMWTLDSGTQAPVATNLYVYLTVTC